MTEEETDEETQVEKFWIERASHFSLEDARLVCQAYKDHIIGTRNFHEMGLIHGGINKAKEDYASFYNEIKGILKPSSEELEILVAEGFDFAGLIALIDRSVLNPYSHRITVNMLAYK